VTIVALQRWWSIGVPLAGAALAIWLLPEPLIMPMPRSYGLDSNL